MDNKLAPPPQIALPDQGPRMRHQMEQGARAADKFWDSHLSSISNGLIIGFVMRLMALFAAQNNPAIAILVFNTIKSGVESLGVIKQDKEH